MATATGLAAALLGLLALLAVARRGQGRPRLPATAHGTAPAAAPGGHPESLTATLDPDSEEYLAWLADHHWPCDEYLDLELEWRNELAVTELPDVPGLPGHPGLLGHPGLPEHSAGLSGLPGHPGLPGHQGLADLHGPLDPAEPYEIPLCPHCRQRREDVWPCPQCGRLLHSSCGHGMRRRRLAHPYRTHASDHEAVVAEWICTGCLSIVGLDVDHGDEADDDLRR
jgi:hypothetical protein